MIIEALIILPSVPCEFVWLIVFKTDIAISWILYDKVIESDENYQIKKTRLYSILFYWSTQIAVKHDRSVGGNTRRSWMFFPTPWVLYRFLSALQQNRAQPRLLSLFYDKEAIHFPAHSVPFSNQSIFSKRENVTSTCIYFLIKRAEISQLQSLLGWFKWFDWLTRQQLSITNWTSLS